MVDFRVTKGNVSDINGLKMAENLEGILVGDKGYISEKWEKYLESCNVKLVTKTRKNMKPKTYLEKEKFYLKKTTLNRNYFRKIKKLGAPKHKNSKYKRLDFEYFSTLATFVSQGFKPPVPIKNYPLIRC